MKLSRSLSSAIAVLSAGTLLAACAPDNEAPSEAPPAGTSTATDGAESGESAEATELTVLGAASTRVANEQLSGLSEQHLEFVNAGSSTLVQQLADGSPGDVLLTADRESMDRAVEEGVAADPVAFATNSMVMVVPAGNPAGITGVDESLEGANVVLCDPQVPCGNVSEQIMADEGIEIEPVSLEHSVSDTLGKVTSGEADAGWVYRTDAQAAGDAVEVFEIPGADKVPNTLYAAVTAGTGHPEQARELVELITSGEMAQVWEDNGFTPAR